jgi:hypothetical protein
MNKEQQKELAIRCLETLDIYKPYINKFKSAGMPCFYENFAGFWADQEPELYSKIKEVEVEYSCLVYAITHEITNYGETWSMLCIPESADGIEDVIGSFNQREYYAFSYTWNKSNPIFSELGDVVIMARLGGIKRVD